MQLSSLEMKLRRYRKRSKKLRSEGLLKARYAMREALEATAWFESIGSSFLFRFSFLSGVVFKLDLALLSKIVQIILDVPTVGGRLMLVDMAGSENIEQAGQNGLEAKMQVENLNYVVLPLCRIPILDSETMDLWFH